MDIREARPYNYKRIRRLARMSNKSEDFVLNLLSNKFDEIVKKMKENGEGTTHLDSYKLSELYRDVTKELGVADEPLTVQASSDCDEFESLSHLMGFDVAVAEKYLSEVGYSSNFINRLKTSPRVEMILPPKYLNPMFKNKFLVFFERQMLKNSQRKEHAISFYARTVADFITSLVKDGKDPFTKLIVNARALPISALKSLVKYKYGVVYRYASALSGFKISKAINEKILYTKVDDRKFQNFSAMGKVYLDVKAKPNGKPYAKQFNEVLAEMGDIGKKIIGGSKKQVALTPEQGVSLILKVEKGSKPRLCLSYRIDVRVQFSFDGVSNIDTWINRQVILPVVNSFNSNAQFYSRVKVD